MEYFIFTLLVIYLSPWLLAEKRERDDATRILFLTLLLGWTVVGWIMAWRRVLTPELPPVRAERPELRVLSTSLPRRTRGRAHLHATPPPTSESRHAPPRSQRR